MIKFKVSKDRQNFINKKFFRKDKVINRFVSDMEAVLKKAVQSITDHEFETGRLKDPSLTELYPIANKFYHNVIAESFKTSQEEKKLINKDKKNKASNKRLASKLPEALPKNIPQDLRGLEKLFRDKRFWPAIMKRSKAIVDRLRKSYLQKLRRKFKELIPRIRDNEITTEQAKNKMMHVWQASKPRVELIFRTETTKYFAKTQVAFFKNDSEIIGFIFDSVPDRSRTDICKSRHGLIFTWDMTGEYSIDRNSPPCHFNCRSHLIALANTDENNELLNDSRRDPRTKKIVDLPQGWR